jgi:hypothetical protein
MKTALRLSIFVLVALAAGLGLVFDAKADWIPSFCVCSSGPCCDGCHYRSSNVSCNFENKTQYGCPWGTGCGSNVGVKAQTRLQYCSGTSPQCTGAWSNWQVQGNWGISEYCSSNQVCVVGNPKCQNSSSCSTKHYKKDCYNNNLYWFDSNGVAQDLYKNCSDNNQCTLDNCEQGQCVNELKCDGSTCPKDSSDYCSQCNYSGDGVCNCGETIDNSPADCKTNVPEISPDNKTDTENPAAAGLGFSSAKEFLKRWYLWILIGLVLIFLFIVIFRRFSSNV